jgi:protein N-terminal amidase
MDLNPSPNAEWTLEGGPYELAQHALDAKANVLLLLNAWLDSHDDPEEETDWGTINYWAARLRPLWAKTKPRNGPEGNPKGGNDSAGPFDSGDSKNEGTTPGGEHRIFSPEMTVVVCNRSGEEDGKPRRLAGHYVRSRTDLL